MTPSTGALERVVRRASARRDTLTERCDLCALPISDDHRHVFDDERGELLCACRACAVLFERSAAGGRHYRLVPQRRVRLDMEASPEDLGVPVGLAFFVRRRGGPVTAHYPSPMGATQYDVDGQAWNRLAAAHPELASMEPDVEAFLVHTARGASERWLVPIDDCYRLVAVIKREWKGLSGGGTVWGAIEQFFAELHPAGRSGRRADG